jgi:anti-sigma factor RsiW
VIDKTTMTEERLRALVDAYGGDPQRWPPGEREAALGVLQSSSQARAAVAQARELDAKLGEASAVPVPAALTNRLLADFEQTSRRRTLRSFAVSLADAVWPGAPLWQPAAAFGLALAIGIGVAMLAPLDLRPTDDVSGAFALDTLPNNGQDI